MKRVLILAFLCLCPIWATTEDRLISGKVDVIAIANDQKQPAAIAVDEGNVYWVTDSGRTIKRISKAGGVLVTVVTGETIGQIVVDEESVFFTVLGEIRRVSKSGGTATALVKADLIGYQRLPLAVDKTNLYYYEEVGVPPGTLDKNPLLRRVRKDGGIPVTLYSKSYMPVGLATDGTNVYWADHINDTVQRMSVNGGRTVILGRCIRPVDVVVDATSVYCKRANGEIIKFNKRNHTSLILSAVQNDFSDHKLRLDQKNLYVMSSYKGMQGIYRISKFQGQPELMVPLQFPLREFAVDEASIYWTDAINGTVMRLNK